MTRRLGFLPMALTVACSSSVDLSSPPHLTASSDPTALAVVNERVQAIAVDDQRIYWTGNVSGSVTALGSVHSCRKEDCVDTLLTYGTQNTAAMGSIGLANGEVYWLERTLLHGQTFFALRACAVDGCNGEPRTVAANLKQDRFSVSGGYGYLSTYSEMSRVLLSATNADPQRLFSLGNFSANSVTAAGDYLYWIGQADYQSKDSYVVQRALADGSGPVETLADHLGVSDYPSGIGVAVDASYVYWTSYGLSGSIVRCPLTGCVGVPEQVISPIRAPTRLILDGSILYWQQDTTSAGEVISRCTVSACVPSEPIARGVDAVDTFGLDDEYIYTATADPAIDAQVELANPLANIRRIRK